MKIDRHTITLIFTVLVTLILLFLVREYLGDSTGEIITIFTAVFGVVAILYQLRKDYQISKAEFIYSLNDTFSNNTEITYIYKKLKLHRDNCDVEFTEEDGRRMGDYVMFFEIMGYLHIEGMITLEMMDKIFSNKFFIFMNNTYVQQYQLRYSEINKPLIELYCVWSNYRLKKGLKELYPRCSFLHFENYVLKQPNGNLCINEDMMAIGYE